MQCPYNWLSLQYCKAKALDLYVSRSRCEVQELGIEKRHEAQNRSGRWERETAVLEGGFEKERQTIERCLHALYTSLRGLRASFPIAMGDDALGLSRRQGRPRKYATVEEAGEARNAARRNRRREEVAMDEPVAAAR